VEQAADFLERVVQVIFELVDMLDRFQRQLLPPGGPQAALLDWTYWPG